MASKKLSKPDPTRLKIRTDCKWFELKDEVMPESDGQPEKVSHQVEMRLRKEAQELFDAECSKYYQHGQSSSSKRTDFNWIRVVLKRGALADKLAAHTLLIQDSAVHNLRSVEELVKMVNSKGKREQLLAMDHLKDIFLGDLLYSKKLRPFAELVAGLKDDSKQREAILILALFEDQLRQHYRNYVEGVEKISHDILPSTKSKAINTMYDLLASNPEQEKFLLEKLVNKLGDPSGKVASHVAYVLKQLVTDTHPAMKTVVVNEVERLLYRPNIKEKAQYYALCFLQELIFRPADYQLANRLVEMYFGFFSTATKKGEVDNKMMNALLTAVSRALPYSNLASTVLEKHMETFYKLVHFLSTNLVIQGLMLMYNVLQGTANSNTGNALTDRFYSVLFKVLLDENLEHCSKIAMFLNLVYRCIKADGSLKRVLAFLKRLLQMANNTSPQLSASIMIIVSEICKLRPEVARAFYGESTGESSIELEPKFKSKKKKQIAKKRAEVEKAKLDKDQEDENDDKDDDGEYNYNVRNPLYANADKSSPWELLHLSRHYHPSVALFAANVKTKKHTSYDGDPLADFTLKHFLNRFVFRNPKTIERDDSGYARQASVFGRLNVKSKQELPLDPKNLGAIPEKKIPIEERFIFKYLNDKEKNKNVDDDVDLESVASDEFEELLDRYENDVDGFDLESGYRRGKNKNKKKGKDQDSESEADDDDLSFMGDDSEDEINFDDDEEYQNAFKGLHSDDDEAQEDGSDQEPTFDEDDDELGPHVRRGRSKAASSLFASADEFAALLEGRDGLEDMGNSSDSSIGSEQSGDEDGFMDPDDLPKKRKRSQDKIGVGSKRKGTSFGKPKRPMAKRFGRKRLKK